MPPVAKQDKSNSIYTNFARCWQERLQIAKETHSEPSLLWALTSLLTWKLLIGLSLVKLLNDTIKYIPVFALAKLVRSLSLSL